MTTLTYGGNQDSVRNNQSVAMFRQYLRRDPSAKWQFIRFLEHGGFLKRIDSSSESIMREHVAMHNWVITELENLGIVQGGNLEKIVDFLLTLEIPPEAIDKGRGDGPGAK